jgi:fucose 4-O-acetylase-like acetyltransferase
MHGRYSPEMEIARGIGILLVTIGHSEPIKTALPDIKEFIYSFHMPLFFFMSGFFSARFRRLGLKEYVWPRIVRLAVPYIFISCMFLIIKLMVPSMVHRQADLKGFLLDIIVYPLNNPALFLWFLYVIIVLKLLTAASRHVSAGILVVISAIPAVTALFRNCDFMAMSHVGKYAVFFMAGLWAAGNRERVFALMSNRYVALCCAVGFMLLYAVYVMCDFEQGRAFMETLIAFAGTFMVISSCFVWYDHLNCRFLLFLGKHSLEIYLIQYFFIFPVYHIANRCGVEPVYIIPFTFLAGMIGPVLFIRYFLPGNRVKAFLMGGAS